jgi:hypothetical protein
LKLNLSDKALNGYLISIESILQFQKSISYSIDSKKVINFILSQYTLLFLFSLISRGDKKTYLNHLDNLKKIGCETLDLEGVTQAHKNYLTVFFINP